MLPSGVCAPSLHRLRAEQHPASPDAGRDVRRGFPVHAAVFASKQVTGLPARPGPRYRERLSSRRMTRVTHASARPTDDEDSFDRYGGRAAV